MHVRVSKLTPISLGLLNFGIWWKLPIYLLFLWSFTLDKFYKYEVWPSNVIVNSINI